MITAPTIDPAMRVVEVTNSFARANQKTATPSGRKMMRAVIRSAIFHAVAEVAARPTLLAPYGVVKASLPAVGRFVDLRYARTAGIQ
jgi:hypothetical protein